MSESELGDEDSRFAKLHGINVHYKAFGPSSGSPKAAIHCFHGFGANTASWTAVHRKMVDALQSQVTTHDMPGFGLTERSGCRCLLFDQQLLLPIGPCSSGHEQLQWSWG